MISMDVMIWRDVMISSDAMMNSGRFMITKVVMKWKRLTYSDVLSKS